MELVMSANPFVKETIGHRDIKNALSDIKADIETAQDLSEKVERTTSIDDEIKLTLHLSGLEIKMTNFAEMLRKKLA